MFLYILYPIFHEGHNFYVISIYIQACFHPPNFPSFSEGAIMFHGPLADLGRLGAGTWLFFDGLRNERVPNVRGRHRKTGDFVKRTFLGPKLFLNRRRANKILTQGKNSWFRSGFKAWDMSVSVAVSWALVGRPCTKILHA